jgi:hypothetical protein
MEDATPDKETINALWERMTREVISAGRVVLIHEPGEGDRVRFCTYSAESLINWRLAPKRDGGGAQLAVLKEWQQEQKEGDDFEIETVVYYRELRLLDGRLYAVRRWKDSGNDKLEVVLDETSDEDGWIVPVLFGRSLDSIPVDIINAAGEGFEYGPVPIMPMVRRAFKIYRLSADYFRSLYIKTDPQIVVYGVEDDDMPDQIGGDAIWRFSNPDARAEMLEPDGLGIPLNRQAIEDEYTRLHEEGGRLRENDGGPESGRALQKRDNKKQVTLKSLVINAASQFEEALRHLARTAGMSDVAVKAIAVRPNLDWTEDPMDPREFAALWDTKLKGAPLSKRTIHGIAVRRDLTDMPYDEEMEAIAEEDMDDIGRQALVEIDEQAPEEEEPANAEAA